MGLANITGYLLVGIKISYCYSRCLNRRFFYTNSDFLHQGIDNRGGYVLYLPKDVNPYLINIYNIITY